MTVGCSIPWERVFQRGNAQHNESVLREECVVYQRRVFSVSSMFSLRERLSMGLRVWCACVWCLEVMSNDDLESDLEQGKTRPRRPAQRGRRAWVLT